jgi:hypothetical protein
MNWLLPVVVGTTAFCYIHSFNRAMKIYTESGFTMTWNEFAAKNIKLFV